MSGLPRNCGGRRVDWGYPTVARWLLQQASLSRPLGEDAASRDDAGGGDSLFACRPLVGKGDLSNADKQMLSDARRFSPAYDRLRFAIDRFLVGKITPMQLQSCCFAHLHSETSSDNSGEAAFWQVTLVNFAVFHHCDFHRSILETSLSDLLASMEATGTPRATPLTTSACRSPITQREHRIRDDR